MAIDDPAAQPSSGANAAFVVADEGVAVIDTFATIDAATQLLADIRRLTARPVKFVINTHYHLDHVAGNGVFTRTGAMTIAQRNVRAWIHRENLRMLADGMAAAGAMMTPEQRELIEGFEPPAIAYENNLDLYLGSRQLHVRSLPGHTGGDSVIVLPDAHVVFTGDLFWRHNLPNTVDSSTKLWIDTLNTLIQENPGYLFIPGHGDVGHADDVTAFREYLTTLRDLVAAARARAGSDNAVTDAVLPALTERYGEWGFFQEAAESNIRQMDAELQGRKRVPASEPTK